MNHTIIIYLILGYLSIINVIGFAMMGMDKMRAKKREWRIPEKTLFTIALIGGSIGSFLGMQLFRHKTKHKSFRIGMPAILIFHVAAGLFFFIQIYYNKIFDIL